MALTACNAQPSVCQHHSTQTLQQADNHLCWAGGKKGGMRLLATYRSTGLAAVMFEADGTGSVQYPNGNMWMSFTAETGQGALYSHAGEVTRTWNSEAEKPIELVLDQHLVCFEHPVVMHLAAKTCKLEADIDWRSCYTCCDIA